MLGLAAAHLRSKNRTEAQAQRHALHRRTVWADFFVIGTTGEDFDSVQLRQLADFAVVVEALRSLSPDAVGVAEEESAVVAGRTLRVKLASQPTLDIGTAVSLAQWYASCPVPSSSAAKQCCDNLRSIVAALQAAIGPTASIWIPLLQDLLKELRRTNQKTYLQRAEDLLRLATHFLKAASARSRIKGTKRTKLSKSLAESTRPKRYPNPLQLVGRAGALIVMKRLVKHKALLSQVSTSALQDRDLGCNIKFEPKARQKNQGSKFWTACLDDASSVASRQLAMGCDDYIFQG
eukprot:s4093_g5.t1